MAPQAPDRTPRLAEQHRRVLPGITLCGAPLDSPISSIADLDDRDLAFVSNELFVERLFEKQGGEFFELLVLCAVEPALDVEQVELVELVGIAIEVGT